MGWYYYFRGKMREAVGATILIDIPNSGSPSGIAAVPYMRESRRPWGIGGFRLNHSSMVAQDSSGVAQRFQDTVA